MDRQGPTPVSPDRDGTSQKARALVALHPDHVRVDERGVRDLLAFARLYGSELAYFATDNATAGNWGDFIGPRLNLDEVAAFMDHPERFSPDSSPLLFRPHFVLFLTFLQLLKRAQQELNSFGRRHLDFYFREFLRLRSKPARPDRVNVLLNLAPGTAQARLSAGTLLTAGPDSLGRERLYATERDVVVNRARVDRLSSVHVARRITGLPEARARHRNDPERAAMAMLEIALGRPEPGDPLPEYPGRGPLDFALLVELTELLGFADSSLHLKFFELRELMKYLGQRRAQDGDEWARINELLEQAGRSRDPSFELDPASRDFDGNLIAAAGGEPPYGQLPEVNDVYDLFDQRTTRDARKFIEEQLHFEYERFVEMMQIKSKIDNEWSAINRLLETAGQRHRHDDPDYRLPVDDPYDFDANLAGALEGIDFSALDDIDSLDAYHAGVQEAERYFFATSERLAYLLAQLTAAPSADQRWQRVDELLTAAHREMRYDERRRRLQEIHQESGFTAMIRYALGEEPGASEDASALERLEPFLTGADDLRLLKSLSSEPDSASADEWQDAYSRVEIAQRNREGLAEPVPREEEWLNIHPARDATARSADEGAETAQWYTFGRPEVRAEGAPPEPVLGWALSSPLLTLSEGTRRIQLTLRFDPNQFDADRLGNLLTGDLLRPDSPVRFQITTEDGWVQPGSVEVTVGAYEDLKLGGPAQEGSQADALRFDLLFPEETGAAAPVPPEVAGLDVRWPVLRLMLGQLWAPKLESYTMPYPFFRALLLSTVHLRISVTGLRPSHLQNDESTLDPKKPFEPFGSTPAAGSRLLIGHPELVTKPLRSLTYHVKWMGAPANLDAHYAAYELSQGANFTVALDLVQRRVERTLNAAAQLFAGEALAVEDVPSAVAPLSYARLAAAPNAEDLNDWDRYLQWRLNEPDFQHLAYPRIAAAKALQMAADIANQKPIDAASYQVNPPYTAKIANLHVDYVSELEIDCTGAPAGDPSDRILHVHPFGACDATAERTADGLPFMPQYEDEGELYVGVRDVGASQTLSLLFQMAEGTADPDLVPEPVRWSYLSADRWAPLGDRKVLLDTTRGFRNSGIVEVVLPSARPSQRLPGDLYWLRASVARNSASICQTLAIHAQAVSATFVDHDNAADHFAQPLPPGTIDKLVEPNPQIAEVTQPYTSEGGRMAEQESTFNMRVSERLRHKQRAVTVWDYERLVLEGFPQIYKAKCIPAGSVSDAEPPGAVKVVVIPDVRKRLPFNPFGPKAPADLLADIQEYLDARTPPAAAVEVVNPHYVAVKVRLGVRFEGSGNEGYFKELLVDQLNRFLSPWAYDEGAEIVVAGKIYANSIVDFLDRRPYVDYIVNIRLFTSDDNENFRLVPQERGKNYFVSAGRPDGVLVAARQHEIDLIPEAGYKQELPTGITFMKVELDLVVG